MQCEVGRRGDLTRKMMFLSKVEDQKNDLMYAIFRNIQLKKNQEVLEKECKTLAQRIIDSQVSRAEENTNVLTLKKERNTLRKKNAQDLQVLRLCEDKINSISSVLDDNISSNSITVIEDKSLKETLQFKDEMITCLQEKLVEMRLQEAENLDLIKSLKETEENLKKDKEKLIAAEPVKISHLQDELVAAKLRESNTSREFWTIRKTLSDMNRQLSQHIEETRDEADNKSEGTVKVTSSISVLWKNSDDNKHKIEKESRESHTKNLQEEATILSDKIQNLEQDLEKINKQVRENEITKSKLQDEINQANIKHRSDLNITSERKRQYKHLQNTADERLFSIRSSISDKKSNIEQLSLKNHNLSRNLEIEETSSDFNSLEIEKESYQTECLQQQIAALEEKIRQLKSTPTQEIPEETL